jgi:hypothetical protein
MNEQSAMSPETMRRTSLHRRGFRENKRGIDQIMAALLMVVIVVVASVMVFVYSTGLFGALLVAPTTATENISLEYAYFTPSNNNVTLSIRNTGSSPITFKSYYVKDSSGDDYARVSWATGLSPQIGSFAPKALASPTPIVLISTACGASCTYSGTAFTFVPGQVYTVVLVTTKNTQFSVQIIR